MLIQLTSDETDSPCFVAREHVLLVEGAHTHSKNGERPTRIVMKTGNVCTVKESPECATNLMRMWSSLTARETITLREMVEDLLDTIETPEAMSWPTTGYKINAIRKLVNAMRHRVI